MASDPEIVAIELIGNLDKFNRDTNAAADNFGKQVDKIEKDAERAEKAVKRAGDEAADALAQKPKGDATADRFQDIAQEAEKAEKAAKKTAVEIGSALEPSGDNKAAKNLGEVLQSAELTTAEVERLVRVAKAAREAFERIPEVQLARQLEPEGFKGAQQQFVDDIVQQETQNIAEGLPESTEALEGLNASSGKAGAGLARFAGYAAAAAAAIYYLYEAASASIAAFEESERNLATLNASLISTGNLSLATASQIEEFAARTADATLQTEASAQTAAATLATVPGLTADAFEDALEVSARFADAMQTDVADVVSNTVAPAFTALADNDVEALYEAMDGLNPVLQETVINLADAGRTADAQAALLNGLAEAAGDGPNGVTSAADKANKAWEDLKAQVGEDIAPAVTSILNAISDSLVRLKGFASDVAVGWEAMKGVLRDPVQGIIDIRVRQQEVRERRANRAAGNGPGGPGDFAGRYLDRRAAIEQEREAQEQAAARDRLNARFGGGGGGGGRPSGPSRADRLQREREEELRRVQAFQRRLQNVQDAVLRGETALADGVEELRKLQLQAIEVARARTKAEIEADVASKKLRQDEADQLLALNDERAKLLAEATNRAADERAQRERLKAAREAFDADEQGRGIDASFASEQRFAQADILQGQLDLARTQKERRELEQRLLDLQFEEEKARNDYLIGYAERLETQEGITASELAIARAAAAEAELRNASLDLRRAQAGEASARATAGPLEAFFQGLPQGADELNEALEGVAAGGLQSVTDGLVGIAVNFQSLEQTALSVLQSITAALVRLAIQQLIVKSLGASLGFSDGGAIVGSPGLAMGGPIRRMAIGGLVQGPGGPTSDSVPALGPNGPIRLSDGEFVLRAAAVQSLGLDTVAELNRSGTIPRLALGGAIGGSGARAAGRGSAGMASLDDASLNRLAEVVSQAAASMPDVNLYPTVDPADALRASLGSRGGAQVFFDFLQANSGRARTAIGA